MREHVIVDLTLSSPIYSLEKYVHLSIFQGSVQHLELLLELSQRHMPVRVRVHQIEQSLQSDVLVVKVLFQLVLDDTWKNK